MDQAEFENQIILGFQRKRRHDTGIGGTLFVSPSSVFEVSGQNKRKPSTDHAVATDQFVYQAAFIGITGTISASSPSRPTDASWAGQELSGTAVGQRGLLPDIRINFSLTRFLSILQI